MANPTVNWETFLARHDLTWDRIPRTWDSGAFIGNGLVGSMIYAEQTNALQWDVGRSDVCDRGDRIAIGRFTLTFPGPVTGDMRLDLWNAEARGTLHSGGRDISWRSFTHTERPVTIIDLAQPKGQSPVNLAFAHEPAVAARAQFRGESIPPETMNPEPAYGETAGVQWCLQRFKAGGGYAVAWTSHNTGDHQVFYFTVDYTADGTPTAAKAVANIQAAAASPMADLVTSHRAWWHAYYPESFLSIPDTRMESFYWIQMYKLASATRADRPAIDLMGPWFHRTPWPHIWWNLNIQLTYWPVYTANRLELGESFVRLIDDHRENLINNVPEAWRVDSAAIGRSSPYDCRRGVSGRPGNEERGDLTWALHDYWLQYRYSGDEKLLRDGLYPMLKRSIGFYLHLLAPGADGKLHLPVSESPEYPKTASDTNYDLALLRWGLNTLLAANERLGLKDPLADKWRDTLARLTPFPIDENGFMIGAGVPFAQSHRHFSHLFALYPLHLMDPQSPADRPLLEKSLDHWQSNKSALRGYSFTGAGAMCAWLGRNNDIVKNLDQLLEFREGKSGARFAAKANTMYTEAGPVIETPLACAASIHEILLQSWSMETFGTHIRVFPAVPDAWKDVSFDRLRAEGAFEVSAVRKDGRTRFVQIKSLAGAPCRVTTGLAEPITASGGREFQVRTEKDRNGARVTTIDLQKGETVLLTSAKDEASDVDIAPVPAQHGRENFFGSPKKDP
jgi:alpha-L-fucosidase 2